MKSQINKILLALALLIALLIIFSSVAFAADSTPRYIVYQNDALEYVKGDYRQAVIDLGNGDARLRNALRSKLVSAIGGFRDVFIIAESGRAIDFQKAVTENVSYLEAYGDPAFWEANPPQPTRELQRDGSEVPLVRVESVSAFNNLTDNTFKVVAELTSAPPTPLQESDFDVVVEIDGSPAPPYNTFSKSADEKEATFTWAAIQPIATEQAVDFSVAYNNTPPVSGSTTIGPVTIEVVSVVPVSRTTIRATLEEDTDPAAAENVANYTVTVGGEAIAVTAASFDSTTDVATLTVDLTGKDGVCIVNGVEADLEVPKVPEFYDINTKAGSKTVVLYFNTKVYDLFGDLEPADFAVTTAGGANAVVAVDVAGSKATARDTITITLADRAVGDTTTRVTLSATGAATIGNIFEEPASPASIQELTPVDTDPPLYTRLLAVEGGYVVYLEFSEDVHTDGENLSAGVGATEDLRVRVRGDRVNAVGDVIAGFDEDDASDRIMVKLDLDRNNLLKSGDSVSARLDLRLQDSDEDNHIRDLSDNVFDGLTNRTASFIKGPGFSAVVADDLAKGDSVKQTFSFTLDGKLESGEVVWIDVSAAAANIKAAYATANTAGRITVNPAASMNVIYSAINERFEVTATADIADGTSAVVTASGLDSTLFTPVEGVEVFFQRRDYGTNKTDSFSVGSGFSGLNVPNLVSGTENQQFEGLTFKLEGKLAKDRKVFIDLSNLAGVDRVDFSKVNVNATQAASTAPNFAFAFSDNVMTLTANAEIPDQTLVTLRFRGVGGDTNIIDVKAGSTGDDYEVIFTRNDTLTSSKVNAEIEASIIIVRVDDLEDDKDNQTQDFVFTVDGELADEEEIFIIITNSKGVQYPGAVGKYTVFGADAEVSEVSIAGAPDLKVTIKANEDIESGTNIRVKATEVDASAVVNQTIGVEIKRDDNDNSDTSEFLVGDGTGTVTVFTTAGLNAALADGDIETIILGGNITLTAAVAVNRDDVTINLNNKKLSDSAAHTLTVSHEATVKNGTINTTNNNLAISGEATFESLEFEAGNLTITADVVFDDVTLTAGTHSTDSKITLADDLTITAGSLTFTGAVTAELDGDDNAVKGAGAIEFNQANMDVKDVAFAAGLTVTMTAEADYEGVTFISAVTSDLENSFDDCQFNSIVDVSSGNVSTFTHSTFNGAVTVVGATHLLNDGNIFNAAVTNTANDSDYTGSVFNGVVTNTAGNAAYTDATFNDDFIYTDGNPLFGGATISANTTVTIAAAKTLDLNNADVTVDSGATFVLTDRTSAITGVTNVNKNLVTVMGYATQVAGDRLRLQMGKALGEGEEITIKSVPLDLSGVNSAALLAGGYGAEDADKAVLEGAAAANQITVKMAAGQGGITAGQWIRVDGVLTAATNTWEVVYDGVTFQTTVIAD